MITPDVTSDVTSHLKLKEESKGRGDLSFCCSVTRERSCVQYLILVSNVLDPVVVESRPFRSDLDLDSRLQKLTFQYQ
jgi:hypothetical protein